MNKILRLPQVSQKTGLSKSSIYAFVTVGKFPRPISLGQRAIGWQESKVDEWIEQRIEASIKHSDEAVK
ncbi:MAG: AlpA family transcriptional regulator [Enterobacterales bacterium]|nr:AlpA family transcriptional regulator [Enterobacterales bacterium]